MTYFFLDTEWADPLARQLVSLALVSEDGLHEFYAEINPLPQSPTDFVRHVVYPLLDGGSQAMPSPDFTKALRHFLLSASNLALSQTIAMTSPCCSMPLQVLT